MNVSVSLVATDTPGIIKLEEARTLLAACRNIDDIKEIRDRARAMQLYARQKRTGEAAANEAGAIVVYASRRLAELYAEEPEGKHAGPGRGNKTNGKPAAGFPGREAAAKAAGFDDEGRELRRLKPLANATEKQVEKAIENIMAAGASVTPAAVAHALVPRKVPKAGRPNNINRTPYLIKVLRELRQISFDDLPRPENTAEALDEIEKFKRWIDRLSAKFERGEQ